ncbi:Veg family protein [Paenibacillus xylanexedens]|uniref:Veg family protein n=1 Tax=Paenibacillus xylanexedens TaxID=528191 RepID=UPI0034D96CB3
MHPTPLFQQTYPSLFILNLHHQQQTFNPLSYTYPHILTHSVQLMVFDPPTQTHSSYLKP